MIEEIVSFETAKMAKDKGFDWKVTAHYRDGYAYSKELITNGSEYNMNDLEEQALWHTKLYSAPTQSLLQKWLREEQGCYIYIRPEPYRTGINFNWQVLFYDSISITGWSDKSTGLYGDNGEYKTFEAALEAALQKALELIQQTNP